MELADTPLLPGCNVHALNTMCKRIHFERQILAESIFFFVEVLVSHKPAFSDNSF